MIDEYQDTNHSQYELMRLLSQSHTNVCVVGDEDQSIYSWRGADIRNILDFEKDFPSVKTIRLEQNYRSTKNILQAASVVVANNLERKGKWLWTEADEGDMLTLYTAHDAENEALFVADTTEKILRQYPDRKVAVLYRTNSQSRQMEEAFRRYNRAYNVIGGFSYYQRAAEGHCRIRTEQFDRFHRLNRIINVLARSTARPPWSRRKSSSTRTWPSWTPSPHAGEERIRHARPRRHGRLPQHDRGTGRRGAHLLLHEALDSSKNARLVWRMLEQEKAAWRPGAHGELNENW